MENQNNLLESIQKGKLKSEQIGEIKNLFQTALADGRLSSREMAQIQFFYYDSELSEEEFSALKSSVFREVVKSAIADLIITEEEKKSIILIAKQLGVSTESRNWAAEQMQKYSSENPVQSEDF